MFKRLSSVQTSTPIVTPIAFLGLNSQSKQPIKMSTALDDILQNADQLFDENQYQEALDVLKKCAVSRPRLL